MHVKFCGKTQPPILACGTHAHQSWEIVLHLTGSNLSVIGDETYPIAAGDVMVIPPGVPHSGRSDSPYTDLFLQCESLDLEQVTVVHDTDRLVGRLLEMLHMVFTKKEAGYRQISDSLLESVCACLKQYDRAGAAFPFVNDLKNTMYRNLSDCDFSLTDAIRRMGYHADYVRRCFRQETGKTPLAFLTGMRLDQAKGLLRQETFCSVVDVAARCGFGDSFYFSKLFKQHTGLSPLNYRKKHMEPRRSGADASLPAPTEKE